MRLQIRLFILPGLFLILASIGSGGEVRKYVDPFIGTGGHGHTFPGATAPFGMVQLSPDTRVEGWDACGGYHYSDSTILGFSHTHLSGTGIADYGDILLMPIDGYLLSKKGVSKFSHTNESASPGYYRVLLEDYQIDAELTATQRVGMHRYTFPSSSLPTVVLDLRHGLGPDRVIESYAKVTGDYEVSGLRRSSGWAKDQYVYFAAQFSAQISDYVLTGDDSVSLENGYASGKNVKCHLHFRAPKKGQVVVKVGISTVSVDAARMNIKKEIPGWDFDAVRKGAGKAWEMELGKIEAEGGSESQLRTFYTALYHAMIAPNVMSDADGRYRGMDGKIRTASGYDMYSVFSLWDTFRAEHPLLSIIDRKRTLGFVKSLLQKSEESGTLPVWELASNETWTMIGYHSVPVIVDAYFKGIRGFDSVRALSAMVHSANLDHFGLAEYRASGFIGGDVEGESVSKTLEYAYDDWCIAEMAASLEGDSLARAFQKRSQSFVNLYDRSTGFFRPKINGGWIEPFDPTSVTVHFTEANPWQYNFFAPHDVEGLIRMSGGNDRFVEKLDSLFYGGASMSGRRQSDITGLIGQYAQGNEPSHHVAYLYDYSGAPWKTQALVRRIMDSLYTDRPDGLCGNDDCGQMSAWYAMSAMGFYQVCPGRPVYALGSPAFRKLTIHLENGNDFVIRAEGNAPGNVFIQSASLGGKPYGYAYLTHEDIARGGTLTLQMGNAPNHAWGSAPVSPPAGAIVPVPYFSAMANTFSDSLLVRIICPDTSSRLHFLVTPPATKSPEESERLAATKSPEESHGLAGAAPFHASSLLLTHTTSIAAWAVKDGIGVSDTVHATFVQNKPIGTLTLNSRYDAQYAGGGDGALLDGVRGGPNFHLGAWQGYHGIDLDAVVDLGTVQAISSVGLGCLQDNNSWIFFPKRLMVVFSRDGKIWGDSTEIPNTIAPEEMDVTRHEFDAKFEGVNARYVKIRASNMGICPPWHKGAGEMAWLFVDEIIVNLKNSSKK